MTPHPHPGFFITFEGGEGAGKTTQFRAVLAHLRASGREPVETREPGGTLVGIQIRQVLLDPQNTRLDPTTELLLYEASRAQLVREVIRPALEAGRLVICDRFADSTLAYQGYGRGLDPDLILRLNQVATGGLQPDLTFLLDLEPVIGLQRACARPRGPSRSGDRLERETLAFHHAVRQGYLALAAVEPQRFVVLDATRSIEAIHTAIREHLHQRLLQASLSDPVASSIPTRS